MRPSTSNLDKNQGAFFNPALNPPPSLQHVSTHSHDHSRRCRDVMGGSGGTPSSPWRGLGSRPCQADLPLQMPNTRAEDSPRRCRSGPDEYKGQKTLKTSLGEQSRRRQWEPPAPRPSSIPVPSDGDGTVPQPPPRLWHQLHVHLSSKAESTHHKDQQEAAQWCPVKKLNFQKQGTSKKIKIIPFNQIHVDIDGVIKLMKSQ